MKHPQVLVVGAGPAGLVTGSTLARLDVPVLVVERRGQLSPFPRATGIGLRSMELFRSWGLEERVRAGEMSVGFSGWVTQSLRAPAGFVTPLGFPAPEQARAVSPTTAAAVPQDHLEPVLLDYLCGFDSAQVQFGAELVGLRQDEAGVTATLCDGAGTRELTVDYVVGADGAHSTVRAAAGIAMIGPDNLTDQLAVLFRAPLWSYLKERRHALYLLQRPGPPTVFLPTDNRDRWLFSMPWDPAVESLGDYPHERLSSIIRQQAGLPELEPTILRVGAFTFAAQIAQRYRDGRLFLAGDAAHRMTPRGGTGMNTAIADGYDIGWKLGWVLRGWAAPELLDTYNARRRPVGARNVERSAIEGPARDSSQDYLDDLNGRLTHATMPDGRSTLDMIGPGLTLLTGPRGRAWAQPAAALDGVRIDVRGVDGATGRRLGFGPDGAVLVRPDATPARAWPALPSQLNEELIRAVQAETGHTAARV